MRRVAAVILTLAACTVVAVVLTGAGGRGGGTYRVDAIFDNASFLIAGQDVRIAGANVGSIKKVSVTPDNRARIAMEIDGRYGPFHADADCFIAPQSLIGERFMQCTPGSTRAPELRGTGDHPPTVPVANTHSPVDADLILSTFDMPTTQRLSLIVNELGAGLAGNGEALNAAIQRANPAVQATNKVLDVVNRDRDTLGQLIDRSDQVIAQLARRKERVASFVGEAAKVSGTAARRRGAIAAGLEQLPATLRETKASLDTLKELAGAASPLLGEVDEAAPALNRVVGDVPAFSDAARPTLDRLGNTARVGQGTLADGAKVVKELRSFSAKAQPAGQLLQDLTENLRERGVPEGLQMFVRNVALTLARFDEYSHIMPAYVVAPVDCLLFARETDPECDAHFVKGAATRTIAKRAKGKKQRRHGQTGGAPAAPQPAPEQPQQQAPAPKTPATPGVTTPAIPVVPGVTVPSVTVPGVPPPDGDEQDNPVGDVLDFLLGG